jgi:hypothetical protein
MTASLPRPHAHIVVTEFEGGESVPVDLDTSVTSIERDRDPDLAAAGPMAAR